MASGDLTAARRALDGWMNAMRQIGNVVFVIATAFAVADIQVAQGLSNQEIADRLFLALSTVKGYTRTLFDKLQVERRTEAVARARELDLL